MNIIGNNNVHKVQKLTDLEHDIISYLKKYGDTRECDLIRAMESLGYGERTIKKKISSLRKRRKIQDIIHDKLKPKGVYLTARTLKQETDYSELHPRYAQYVARIDWLLEHVMDEKKPEHFILAQLLKLKRDYYVKQGKALGR